MEEIFCPHLGIRDGTDSHFGYPSRANRCYRTGEPAKIDLDHQDSFCLDAAHTTCPIFLNPPARLEPSLEPILTPEAPRRPRLALILGLSILALLILLGAALGGIYLLDRGQTLRLWLSRLPDPFQSLAVTPTQIAATHTPDQLSLYPPPPLDLRQTQTALHLGSPTGELELDNQAALLIDPEPRSALDDPDAGSSIERPDSYQFTLGGETGLQLEPRFNIPVGESYRVVVDGQQLDFDPGPPATFTQRGPGYLVRVEGLLAEDNSQESLRITPDGKSVWYQASEENEIDIFIEFTGVDEQVYLALRGLDAYSRRPISVILDPATGTITVNNEGFISAEYNLRLGIHAEETMRIFLQSAIPTKFLQSHELDYTPLLKDTQPKGPSELFLTLTNLRGDGNSQRLVLENQAYFLFAQMLLK